MIEGNAARQTNGGSRLFRDVDSSHAPRHTCVTRCASWNVRHLAARRW